MSRHRKIRLSRSKAIVIAAAGALSVATAASAAATTSPQGTRGHAAGSDRPTEVAREAAGLPRLSVTDQLARPVAEAGNQQTDAILTQHALRLRLTQTREAIARRQAARKRAAELAASKAAAQRGQTAAAAVPAASGSPRQLARAMLGSFGWLSSQFSCLDPLWEHESRWSVTAANPGSGAFGIPQALPGSRMASAGPDWQTSAATQITWGLRYVRDTYGSPCAAWSHEQATGWY
ncbi:MAG TPA: lytic transglycosylase domain-containing protein [Streptosporangiaceae bacterium]